MTDPSKLFQQHKKQKSPAELDERILNAARTQAQENLEKANAEKKRAFTWQWVTPTATAAVLVIGITFAFNFGSLELEDDLRTSAEYDIPGDGAFSVDLQETTTESEQSATQLEELIVTGIRDSLKSSADIKREESGVVDSITAEDIGKFPDANLAESLQRITGVSIERASKPDMPIEEDDLNDAAKVQLSTFSSDSNSSRNRDIDRDSADKASTLGEQMPPALIEIRDQIPTIVLDIKYANSDNFVGEPILGYNSPRALLSKQAVDALKKVQTELARQGLGLKIFDAYRPQRAVDHFLAWAENDDISTKPEYYPRIEKAELFSLGYLSERSSHSRGSTVDLTVIHLDDARELDMGTIFDFFDPRSWPDSKAVSEEAQSNRMLLQEVMLKHGFLPFETEWWHFTLDNEPYPDQYFDVPIE